jgi:hypothetical protein
VFSRVYNHKAAAHSERASIDQTMGLASLDGNAQQHAYA